MVLFEKAPNRCFPNRSNLTHHYGNVDISNNTVFRNGCDISIISEQNIKLSNIVINSGAKVTLCGENINIGSGVKIEKGAIVSFINKERQ